MIIARFCQATSLLLLQMYCDGNCQADQASVGQCRIRALCDHFPRVKITYTIVERQAKPN